MNGLAVGMVITAGAAVMAVVAAAAVLPRKAVRHCINSVMKQICILLTKYSDWISSLVYYIGGQGTYHSSIALGGQPTQFYSFNCGFAVETENRRRGVRCSHRLLNVSDTVLSRIERESGIFLKTGELPYTRLGVLCCVLRLPLYWKNHYFCSQFVVNSYQSRKRCSCPKAVCFYLPKPFYTPVGDKPLPCRNGTGYYLK